MDTLKLKMQFLRSSMMGSDGVEAFGVLTGSHHMCGKTTWRLSPLGGWKLILCKGQCYRLCNVVYQCAVYQGSYYTYINDISFFKYMIDSSVIDPVCLYFPTPWGWGLHATYAGHSSRYCAPTPPSVHCKRRVSSTRFCSVRIAGWIGVCGRWEEKYGRLLLRFGAVPPLTKYSAQL